MNELYRMLVGAACLTSSLVAFPRDGSAKSDQVTQGSPSWSFVRTPQDGFMQRIQSHLDASSYNRVTAYVTVHTAGWDNNNFTAFAEVDLNRTLVGTATYLFSDRWGYPSCTTWTQDGFFSTPSSPATRFDANQIETGRVEITIGPTVLGSGEASVDLGLWGWRLTHYTVNPDNTLIFGYLDGAPQFLVSVSVKLWEVPEPPK